MSVTLKLNYLEVYHYFYLSVKVYYVHKLQLKVKAFFTKTDKNQSSMEQIVLGIFSYYSNPRWNAIIL